MILFFELLVECHNVSVAIKEFEIKKCVPSKLQEITQGRSCFSELLEKQQQPSISYKLTL